MKLALSFGYCVACERTLDTQTSIAAHNVECARTGERDYGRTDNLGIRTLPSGWKPFVSSLAPAKLWP